MDLNTIGIKYCEIHNELEKSNHSPWISTCEVHSWCVPPMSLMTFSCCKGHIRSSWNPDLVYQSVELPPHTEVLQPRKPTVMTATVMMTTKSPEPSQSHKHFLIWSKLTKHWILKKVWSKIAFSKLNYLSNTRLHCKYHIISAWGLSTTIFVWPITNKFRF